MIPMRLALLVAVLAPFLAMVVCQLKPPSMPPKPPKIRPAIYDVKNVRDYVFWKNDGSRVKDITDLMDSKHKISMISLSESAVYLEELIRDKPLQDRCERYVQMFQLADVRTTEKMKKLSRRIYKNLEQPEEADKDLSAKFKYELEFGALNKLRILQAAFENQFHEFASRSAQPVRNDLFECIAYFMTRHRSSSAGVEAFIEDSIELVSPLVYEPKSPMLYIEDSMKKLNQIEQDANLGWDLKKGTWAEEAKRLYLLFGNNRYQINQEMMQFMNADHRMQLLTHMLAITDRIDYLRNKIIEVESLGNGKRAKSHESYRDWLLEVFTKIMPNVDWLPNRTSAFVHHPQRWNMMRKTVSKFRGLSPFEFQAIATEPEGQAMQALRHSCPLLSRMFKRYTVELRFDDKLTAEKAQWLLNKLHHSLLGCQGLEVDKSHPIGRAWQVYSLTLKLSDWAIKRRTSSMIDQTEKAAVTDILYKLP